MSALLVLTACGGSSTSGDGEETASSETRTVEADNGTIEVPTDPQRVVAIGSAIAPFVDLGGQPVGVTELSSFLFDKFSPEQQSAYEGATVIGTSAGEVDLEKLAGLKPDLILMLLPQADYDQVKDQLQSIAPTVFYSLETDGRTAAEGIAEASNSADTFDQQKKEFEDRLATIKDTYSDIIGRTSFINTNRWSASDPGTFVVDNSGCAEIGEADLGIGLPELKDDAPFEERSFEQLKELSEFDAIMYPVDLEGKVQEVFAPVMETNTWKALPAVESGRTIGIYCASNSSYGFMTRYLDSLETGLESLAAKE